MTHYISVVIKNIEELLKFVSGYFQKIINFIFILGLNFLQFVSFFLIIIFIKCTKFVIIFNLIIDSLIATRYLIIFMLSYLFLIQ